MKGIKLRFPTRNAARDYVKTNKLRRGSYRAPHKVAGPLPWQVTL